MEIIITIGIVALATYIIYKNIRKSSNGDCACSSCSKHCPARKEDN